MFTGIIEEIGYVISLVKSDSVLLWDGTVGEGYILTIRCKTVLDGAYLGCSIAVNGTCLTVTSFTEDSFTVGCAPETYVMQAELTHEAMDLPGHACAE